MEISSAAATGRALRRVRVLSEGDCMLVEGFWFVGLFWGRELLLTSCCEILCCSGSLCESGCCCEEEKS